jgi:hypothetical protein
MYLGTTTNNIGKYSDVIKLLFKVISLDIHHLVVVLDSHLMVSELKYTYSVRHIIILCKYLRVHLLERYFDHIEYFHVQI